MSQYSLRDVTGIVVVVMVLAGATLLAYVGRIDAMVVNGLYFGIAAYVFGYAHGSAANGNGKKGP